MIDVVFSFLLGYLIGSVPTAYLLVQWKARLDIRAAGSGNAGALNTFDVTGSKLLGLSVLLLDLAKGIGAVWAGSMLPGAGVATTGASGIGAVAGHNYPVWLGFRGGRGLATAAGAMLVLSWPLVALWCVLWGAVYAYAKNVHAANIVSSFLSPALAFPVLNAVRPAPGDPGRAVPQAAILMSALCFLILLRHLRYFPELRKVFHKSE